MIEAYCGLIGGGKTYSAVLRMLSHMARGGCVVSNIQLQLDPWKNTHRLFKGTYNQEFNAKGCIRYLKEYFNWRYQPGQYRYIQNSDLLEHGVIKKLPAGLPDLPVLLVWDEGADFWDSEDRKDADREFLSLLRHSRKLGMDFVFVIQEFTELNKRIRNQTMYVWKFIDMATFRVPGLGIGVGWFPMLKNQIRVLQFHRSQYESKSNLEPVYLGWVDKKQDIFSCYKTDALHTGIKVLLGEDVDFRGRGCIVRAGLSFQFCFFSGFCFMLLILIWGGVL